MRIIGSKDLVASVIAEQRKELSGQSFVNPSAQVAVASVDTLMSRMDHLGQWLRTVDLTVCDEAHHPSVLWAPSEAVRFVSRTNGPPCLMPVRMLSD
jgi:hypothetical protein